MIAPVMPRLLAVVIAAMLCLATGCGDSKPATQPSPAGPPAGFLLTGDPTSANGATWTYQATTGGVTYDLQGILFKPAGTGTFPAVIVSHGAGGNANGYSRTIARTMVAWGLVVMATNYTHAGNAPVGSPGTAADPGASTANIARARQLVELLRGLGYVDMNRIALHGHSMGGSSQPACLARIRICFEPPRIPREARGRTASQARRRRTRKPRRFARPISFTTATATTWWHCHPTSGSRLSSSVMAPCTSCTCTWAPITTT